MGSLPRLRSLVSKLRFVANPHAHIRPAGTLAAIGLVASLINPVAQPTAAAASIEEPILASLEINKVADGTGHGTAGATFVNSDNGFNPGDNTPNDGIVSSRDVVLYQMSLNLTAGKRRTVKVSWDLSDAPYLTSDLNYCTDGTQVTAQKNNDGSCSFTIPAGVVESVVRTLYLRATDTVGTYQPNQAPKLVIERVPSDPANTGQRFETSVAKVGVVSAPAADLTIRDYGRDDDGAIDERRIRMPEDGSPTEGYFDITVDAVGYPGYSSNGASTGGPWSTSIDVTAFPKYTTWAWTSESGEKTTPTSTEQDGKQIIRLENQHGAGQLSFSIPFAAIDGRESNTDLLKESDKALAYNGYKEFNIQLIPDENIFQTGDLKNLGTGGEPGRNQARDVTTEDSTTGSKAGYPFPNNDWSRAVIDRGPGPGDGRFGKRIQLPYTKGATIFDEGNVYFDKASSIRTVTTSPSDGLDQVAQGAQSRNRPHLILRKNNGKPAWWGDTTQAEYMGDVWNPLEQQWDGNISMQLDYVENGQTKTLDLKEGREYEVVGYILRQDLYNAAVESTCKAAVAVDPSTACIGVDEASPQSMGVDETGKNLREALQWQTGDPRRLTADAQKNVAGIQVKLIRNSHFVTKEESYVDIYQQAVTSGESRLVLGEYDWSADATKWAAHLTIGTVIQKSYDQSSKVWDHAILERKTSVEQKIPADFGSLPDAVVAKAPQAPLLTLDNLLVDPKNPSTGKLRDGGNALPGDTASYTVNAHLDNIPLSGTAVQPTLALTLPATLIDPISTSAFWVIKEIREPNAKGEREVIFEPKDPTYVPQLDLTGKAVLPTLTFDATVSNLAVSKIAVPAVAYATTQARGIVPSYSLATQAKIVELNVVTDGGTSSAIKTIIPYTEVNDQIGYHFNIYAGGTKFSRSDKAVTVIRFPNKTDEAMLGKDGTGLDGSWTDYPNRSSSFYGTYTLAKEVEYRSDNGTPTQILYSRTNKNSFTPEDFEWLTWEELGDDKTVAAIKVVSELQKRPVPGTGETFPVAAADGNIYLQPADGTNRKGDKYVMWLGNTRFYNNNDEKVMDPKTDTQLMGTVPWAAKAEITSSTITGTTWWDNNRDSSLGTTADEHRIKDVEIDLWKVDDNGNKVGDQPFRTTTTDEKGFYSFTELHSGKYLTEVKRVVGLVTPDPSPDPGYSTAQDNGVATEWNTYYNQNLPVVNTRSWKDILDRSKNYSGVIDLPITSTIPRVDFGFAKTDPRVTLDKTNVTQSCTATDCSIYWDVTVTNTGNDVVKAGAELTDVMSSNDRHQLTSATVGMEPTKVKTQRFQQVGLGSTFGVAIDIDGNLWMWGTPVKSKSTYTTGENAAGGTTLFPDGATQVLKNPTQFPVKDASGVSVHFKSISVGDAHMFAIDTQGRLWGWGDDFRGRVTGVCQKSETAYPTVRTPVLLTPDENASTKWRSVTTKSFGTMAVTEDGRIWSWGTNEQNQVVVSSDTPRQDFSTAPTTGSSCHAPAETTASRFVDSGSKLTTMPTITKIDNYRNGWALLDSDGNVWTTGEYIGLAWGFKVISRGDGYFRKVVDESGQPISAKDIAVGEKELAAVKKNGTGIYYWGLDYDSGKYAQFKGAASIGTNGTIEKITGAGASRSGASSSEALVVTDSTGKLYRPKTWGNFSGDYEQVDLGVDGLATGLQTITANAGTYINASFSTTPFFAGIDYNGNLWTWGESNANYRLGHETDSSTVTSVAVNISPADVPDPDLTAQPIEAIPTSVTTADGQTSRTYATPRDLEPGASVIFHFTSTVPRPKVNQPDVKVSNQARFSAPNVPYSNPSATEGVPAARGASITTPTAPNRDNLKSTKDITGTTACVTGTDAGNGEDTADTTKEHSFSDSIEDSCDQVGAVIPAQTYTPPRTENDGKLGTISGHYWFDENRDGLQNDNNPRVYPHQLVILLDATTGEQLSTTTTDETGAYQFTDLPIDRTYQVMFSRVRFAEFTTNDVEDSKPSTDHSTTDSDASLDNDNYGLSTVTIDLTAYPGFKKPNVDVGVYPYAFNLMPHTGLGRWIFTLSILVVLTGGCGLWFLRRRALAS